MRHLLTLLAAAFVAFGCSTRPVPRTRFVAVMGAYGPEMQANRAAIGGTHAPLRVWNHNGVRFEHHRLDGLNILLFPSGVSMVNAAMTTQLALDRFRITHVLFAGIAGGIDPARRIGDVVVPGRWFHHSEAVYANPRTDGPGHVLPSYFKPPYENFGFMYPDHVSVIRSGMEKPADVPSFPADARLLELARAAVADVPPLRWSTNTAAVHVGGAGISGPVFMDNREYRRWAFRVWRAGCLDMESTAVAQVCWANRTPFLVIRSLSDLAGGQEGINAADTTEVPISTHAAQVLRAVLARLAPAPQLGTGR